MAMNQENSVDLKIKTWHQSEIEDIIFIKDFAHQELGIETTQTGVDMVILCRRPQRTTA